MTDDPGLPRHVTSPSDRSESVRALAEQALAIVVARRRTMNSRPSPSPVERLCQALIHPDDSRRNLLVSELMSAGMSAASILNAMVPESAKLLGERWNRGELSFVEVTIASARLQEMVRSFDDRTHNAAIEASKGAGILLISPDYERHTLGVLFAAHEFRELGFSVRLGVGWTDSEILSHVRHGDFALVGISIAQDASLLLVKGLTGRLKKIIPHCPPIVIGGSVCAQAELTASDFGADLISISPSEVASFLQTKRHLDPTKTGASVDVSPS